MGPYDYRNSKLSDIVTYRSGRHFLQLPGPTNVPDRVLRAMARPTIDHRGPDFPALTRAVLDGLRRVFGTEQSVFIYPSAGNGGWEAALVNTLSPGDRVMVFEHGFFAAGWARVAERLELAVTVVPGDWHDAVDPATVEQRLREDASHEIRAVLMVHNETSTGVTSDVAAVRRAMDAASHPALLMVDAVSSLGSMEYRHDEWGVDVTVSGSQKGLMLPPGLGFNAVGARAMARTGRAKLPRSYWDWNAMRQFNEDGFFPYTPATNLLFGLREALAMLEEEGLDRVFRRHARHAAATRAAVSGWELTPFAREETRRSNTITAVEMPEGVDADAVRRVILDRFDMSLGGGLGALKGRVIRIGHLGDFNDLMLAGTLSGIEMGLRLAGVPHRDGGVGVALDYLASHE